MVHNLEDIENEIAGVSIEELKRRESIHKADDIETFIYSKYSAKIQAQDNGWKDNFRTKLVASGVADIDTQVVEMASSFLKGKKLSKILAGVSDQVRPMYEKLVKVAVKNEWALLCIQEGKKAIAQNREPVYAQFPKFD